MRRILNLQRLEVALPVPAGVGFDSTASYVGCPCNCSTYSNSGCVKEVEVPAGA